MKDPTLDKCSDVILSVTDYETGERLLIKDCVKTLGSFFNENLHD